MSEQWKPKADDFRQVWAAFNGYGGLIDRPSSVSMDEGYAEFDRWLDQVKADAWDECVEAGAEHVTSGHPGDLPNPYRQEATR